VEGFSPSPSPAAMAAAAEDGEEAYAAGLPSVVKGWFCFGWDDLWGSQQPVGIDDARCACAAKLKPLVQQMFE